MQMDKYGKVNGNLESELFKNHKNNNNYLIII